MVSIGYGLGYLAAHIPNDRNRVVQKNLELCFPELDAAAREALARDRAVQRELKHIIALVLDECEEPNPLPIVGRKIRVTKVPFSANAKALIENDVRGFVKIISDPATGVMRHADAGYDIAIATAAREGIRIPMQEG